MRMMMTCIKKRGQKLTSREGSSTMLPDWINRTPHMMEEGGERKRKRPRS